MNIYISSSIQNIDEVLKAQTLCIQHGHTISVDWTRHKPPVPYSANLKFSQYYAEIDVKGVQESDIFLLLHPKIGGRAMLIELGVAMERCMQTGKPKIYIIGNEKEFSMFYYHPVVNRRETIEEVLDEIG